jgi:hypothetical protein
MNSPANIILRTRNRLPIFEEAEKWFKQAMAIDEETVKREAIDDPDLKPFWDSMSGSGWKSC